MNILITNDDGFQSSGLKILADKLAEKNKVYIVAPDSNRSAVSHHFTMYNENTIKKISDNMWNCSGYPADCVFAGTSGALFPEPIDVVVAGINYGSNLGTDIIYSGTCAAARQALLQNIPAVAFSVDPIDWNKVKEDGFKFEALADFAAKNIEQLVAMVKMDCPRAFINVNGASLEKYKGVKISETLCVRKYADRLQVEPGENGELHTKLIFGGNGTDAEKGSDYAITREDCISVSRVYVDPICCPCDENINFKL